MPLWIKHAGLALSSLLATRKQMDLYNKISIDEVAKNGGELTIILHGVFATYYGAMSPFAKFLRRAGINTVSIGYDYRADPKTEALDIGAQIDNIMRQAKVTKINLVGVSLGGVVARYYTEILGNQDKINKLVTVFTPMIMKSTRFIATYINKLISRTPALNMSESQEMIGHYTVKKHLAIYGLNDYVVGKEYPLPNANENVTQVAVSGGHSLVSYNTAVMNVVADYLKK